MRVVVLLVAACGCGRIGFDAPANGGMGSSASDAQNGGDGGSDGSLSGGLTTIDPMTTGSIIVMGSTQGTIENDEGAPEVFGGTRTLGVVVTSVGATSTAFLDSSQHQVVYNHNSLIGGFFTDYIGNGSLSVPLDPSAKIRIRVFVDTLASPCGLTVTLTDAVGPQAALRVITNALPADIDIPVSEFVDLDPSTITRIRIQFGPASQGGNVIAGPFTIVP